MTTITRTSDSASSSPELVLGYDTERTSATVVHDLLEGIAVTVVAARPRSGTIEYFYPVEADAFAALELHADLADTFTLSDATRPDVGMVYVALSTALALDDETRDAWVLSVEYQEIIL